MYLWFLTAVIISSFNAVSASNFLNLSVWVNFFSSCCQLFALIFGFLIFINNLRRNFRSLELSKADEQQLTVKSNFHRRTIFTIIFITFYQFNIIFSRYRPSGTPVTINHRPIDQKAVSLPILCTNTSSHHSQGHLIDVHR